MPQTAPIITTKHYKPAEHNPGHAQRKTPLCRNMSLLLLIA
jgi:hypothetical protein